MVAVGVIGVIALLIAVVGDLPDITQAGTVFTERYEDAVGRSRRSRAISSRLARSC